MKNIHILKTSIIKKMKSGKLKTWKPQRSRKYFSEFSYFQVFNFALQPKSKAQIQKAQKKISEISKVFEFFTRLDKLQLQKQLCD